MDEMRVVDSDLNQSQPTTSESGPGGPAGGAPGSDGGDNKRDALNTDPTVGSGIAGRDTEGNSTVADK